MSIREHTQQIISVYLDAVPTMKMDAHDDKNALDKVAQAETYLEEIATIIDTVIDVNTDNAGKLQMKIIDTMGIWANEFTVGNFSQRALISLSEAVEIAKEWASCVPKKQRSGVSRLFHKKTSKAVEIPHYNADDIFSKPDTGHYRIQTLASYPKAKEKIAMFGSLIEKVRAGLHDSELLEWQQEIDVLKQEKIRIEEEMQAVASQETTKKGDGTLAERLALLVNQFENTNNRISYLSSMIGIAKATDEMIKPTLELLEETYDILTQHEWKKRDIVSLSEYINLDIIQKIINCTVTLEEMQQLTNMHALVKAVQSMECHNAQHRV